MRAQATPIGGGAPTQRLPAAPSPVLTAGNETGTADGADGSRQQPEIDGGLSGDALYRKWQHYDRIKIGERQEAWVARTYYHGTGQWNAEQLAVLRQRKQLPTYYNRIRRKVNFLVGTEQRLRRDPKAYARHPKWEADSSAATHCLRFVQDATDAPSEVSLATADYMIQGVGVLYQSVVAVNGQADPTKRHVPADRFFYDPRSERHDFSDAKFLGLRQRIEVDSAVEMFEQAGAPQAAEMIRALGDNRGSWAGLASAEFARARVWVDDDTDSVDLIEMYYRYRGQWRLAFLIGSIKLYDRPSIFLAEDGTSRHAFNAMSCEIDEQGDRYGIVRDMIPIQDQINHRLSKLLYLLSMRQMLYEKGALVDPNRAHREFQRADGKIELQPGALEKKRVEIVQATVEIQGQAELLQSAIAEIENIGPNPGLVGRGEGINTQSGRAILAQQNAGMTELSPIFERIRTWKLRSYRIDWAAIRQFWSGERFIRVTDGREPRLLGINQVGMGPDGSLQVMNDVGRLDVDIVLEEGPDTITVREEMLDTFAKLGPNAVGPLGKVIIELSNVPDKDKLIGLVDQMSTPPPEVQAMQKRLAEIETALKEAQVGKTQADTAAQHAAIENKRADTLVKLAEILAPVEALDGSFPRAFSDVPGVQPPQAPMMLPVAPLAEAQQAPTQQGLPQMTPDAVSDSGPNGVLPDGPAPIMPLDERPPLAPGEEPLLGSPGTLPMPVRPDLPAQGGSHGVEAPEHKAVPRVRPPSE